MKTFNNPIAEEHFKKGKLNLLKADWCPHTGNPVVSLKQSEGWLCLHNIRDEDDLEDVQTLKRIIEENDKN